MRTQEPVDNFLKADRAIGTICSFLGTDKKDYSTESQESLNQAFKDFQDAWDKLQTWIYEQCGVK